MHQVWTPTTSHKRGDVILVRYPNSDLRTYRFRPALVVQTDNVITRLPQRIVALITSNLRRTGPSRVRVRMNSSEGRAMGLRTDSVVVLDNLATVHDRAVDRIIGRCTAMGKMDAALVAVLGL